MAEALSSAIDGCHPAHLLSHARRKAGVIKRNSRFVQVREDAADAKAKSTPTQEKFRVRPSFETAATAKHQGSYLQAEPVQGKSYREEIATVPLL